MQMGFNNDVAYGELTLHIQTEDHGLPAAKITSQVFFAGAVLESKTISYAKEIEGIADVEERDERIRTFMKALHRKFYKRIHDGTYDGRLPIGGEGAAVRDAAARGQVGIETPEELLVEEGFAIAGEHAELGATYEAHSRGEPMGAEEFEPGKLVDEIAAAASGMGQQGFVQLGGIGSGSYVTAQEAVTRTRRGDEVAYGDRAAYRGLDADFSDWAPLLLEAMRAS